MITGFILGYAALSAMLPRDISYVFLNLIGAVLVMGSVFVLSVAVLALSTAKDISRLVHLEQEVIVDALTGIYNRRFFDEQFDREIGRASRTGTNLGLLIVDVDRFKEINDTHGHAIGDRVLAMIASIMSEEIRKSDIPVRYGGDEFAIIAPAGDRKDIAGLADRLCRKIGSTFVTCSEGRRLSLSVSIGFATLQMNETGASLFRRADGAVYKAKKSGRNCALSADEHVTAQKGNISMTTQSTQ